MANIKVSELTTATTFDDSDYTMIVQSGENKKITKQNIFTNLITYNQVENLSLNGGDTYQLTLPNNVLFVEPLVQGDGGAYSGGCFLTLTDSYNYFVNNDSSGTYRGIWIKCNSSGLITISNYKHSGNVVKGFRIWYLNI